PKKVSIDDLITFIVESKLKNRRDIVIAGSQKFKVSERHIYNLMLEGFENGELIKNGDKWVAKEKQVDLF
ncbi:unnamed protein product, partial [marine sediment metagenome]